MLLTQVISVFAMVTIMSISAFGMKGYGSEMGGYGGYGSEMGGYGGYGSEMGGYGSYGSGMEGYGGGMEMYGGGMGGYGVGMKHFMAKPYGFGYQIPLHGGQSHHVQKSDGTGSVKGSYGYKDAKGIYRNVEYVADHGGFKAKVMTNEPGTKDHIGKDPAHVIMMTQHTPPGIQEKYTSMNMMGGAYGGIGGMSQGGFGGKGGMSQGGFGGMGGMSQGGFGGMGGDLYGGIGGMGKKMY